MNRWVFYANRGNGQGHRKYFDTPDAAIDYAEQYWRTMRATAKREYKTNPEAQFYVAEAGEILAE